MSSYWQHNKPLNCPKDKTPMIWLGSAFWICDKCEHDRIYVQQQKKK